MYDPDIEDEMEAIEAVNIYEWTLTDGIHSNGLYTKWQEVDVIHIINQTHVSRKNVVNYSCVNLYNNVREILRDNQIWINLETLVT